MKYIISLIALLPILSVWAPLTHSSDEQLVSKNPRPGYLFLHGENRPAEVVWDEGDYEVVKIAARGLMSDLLSVTGEEALSASPGSPSRMRIIVGSVERSPLIKSIVHSTSLDLSHLEGAWESFVIKTVEDPQRPGKSALLIAGSDRRGTAYGVYELSQAMGVSPWHWWADVTPQKAKAIYINKGLHRFGPPSVQYRGIFINDEDWGLQPWASQYEKGLGNIGPKTYEKVFDLLLRLKANTLWPAMHKVSLAFNEVPENKVLADRYGIVMGSSHAEPMLRNNVKEWPNAKSSYNFATHRQQVLNYWEQRVKENGQYENIYSIGMRGIHDSGMSGGASNKEKIALLEDIFQQQRKQLQTHVDPKLASIPQAFTPYKEVLALYRDGLTVPDDISLIWPDDNHGYIRQLPNDQERSRSGGSGVYYHLSYLGSPLSYLWLYSTPTSLVWEEMTKAYALGARKLWIANVGDIKPAEIGMDFFLQMAWDIDRWTLENQHTYLESWAQQQFSGDGLEADPGQSKKIGEIMRGYFELNFQRKPEHLQWWLPHSRSKGSNLSADEVKIRLANFEKLEDKVLAIKTYISAEQYDAFFQLVEYPVLASAMANRRYFHAEQYSRWFHESLAMAKTHGQRAVKAQEALTELTRLYNEDISNGKWHGMMSVEPADNLWRSYRQSSVQLPASTLLGAVKTPITLEYKGVSNAQPDVYLEAEAFIKTHSQSGSSWEVVRDLGRVGDAVVLYPMVERADTESDIEKRSPYLEYEFELSESGGYYIYFSLLPSFPVNTETTLKLAFSMGDSTSGIQMVTLQRQVKDRQWKRAVLSGSVRMSAFVSSVKQGKQRLRVYGVDSGVVLDQIFVSRQEIPDSFRLPQ
ncbi:glycosyl hydrolase 115 family protein [Teredinibacter franksiae]|uniref:glycosyl hydrolase 115 family protein n=1 Tax=Teredinibacter franksiae TaxID=2761453 RepID=UPI001626783B|nr:glycosyl hydrolase 115 family protein [Teredinibacter franksiae]